jgi:hypothetical protein
VRDALHYLVKRGANIPSAVTQAHHTQNAAAGPVALRFTPMFAMRRGIKWPVLGSSAGMAHSSAVSSWLGKPSN